MPDTAVDPLILEEPLPAGCEDIYSTEMKDEELHRLLADIPKQIVAGLKPALQEAEKPEAPDPKAEGGVVKWGKWVLLVGGILAILTTAGIVLNYVVSNAINTGLTQSLEGPQGLRAQIGSLRDKDVGGINTRLDEFGKNLERLRDWQAKFIFSPTNSAGRSTPEEIKTAARQVLDRKLLVTIADVKRLGNPLLQEPITAAKWEALLELINVRSFVNTTLDTAKLNIVGTFEAKDFLKGGPGTSALIPHYSNGWVVIEGTGKENMILENTGMTELYENMIARNLNIVYTGGPLTLVNVFFENCTFSINQTPEGKTLVAQILNSDYPTFKAH